MLSGTVVSGACGVWFLDNHGFRIQACTQGVHIALSISPPSPEPTSIEETGIANRVTDPSADGMVLINTSILERLRGQVVVLARRYATDVSDLQGRMESVKEEADRRMALVIAYRERAKIYAELSRLKWWSRKRRKELLDLLELDTL